MKFLFGHNLPSVVLMSLVLLASAQRSSNTLHRDLDFEELSRQNKITKQILEAFIQKKLGLARHNVRAPSIKDILPVAKQTEGRPIRELGPEEEVLNDTQDLAEDDNLQSVESEQIDSIYPDQALRDRDITELLNNSEFEDSSGDEDFIEDTHAFSESRSSADEDSSESSDSFDSDDNNLPRGRGGSRSLGRATGRRGRPRRRTGCRVRTRGGICSQGPSRLQDAA